MRSRRGPHPAPVSRDLTEASRFEVEANLAGEGAILVEFSITVAGGLVHLVIAGPDEMNTGFAVAAIQAALDGAEDEVTTAIGVDLDVPGFEHVDELGIPEFHLRNPPFADQGMIADLPH